MTDLKTIMKWLKHLDSETVVTYYDIGASSYHLHIPISQNPYIENSPAYDQWLQGWLSANGRDNDSLYDWATDTFMVTRH